MFEEKQFSDIAEKQSVQFRIPEQLPHEENRGLGIVQSMLLKDQQQVIKDIFYIGIFKTVGKLDPAVIEKQKPDIPRPEIHVYLVAWMCPGMGFHSPHQNRGKMLNMKTREVLLKKGEQRRLYPIDIFEGLAVQGIRKNGQVILDRHELFQVMFSFLFLIKGGRNHGGMGIINSEQDTPERRIEVFIRGKDLFYFRFPGNVFFQRIVL